MSSELPGSLSTPLSPNVTWSAPVQSLPSPTVTVVICAYTANRWEAIQLAVGSVCAQLAAGDELIVVIDHNAELRNRAAASFTAAPLVRVLANAHARGLSGARNTGVEAARGDVVAFLDDDAAARPGWLAELRGGFADPAVAVVGTAVVPRWAGGRRPRWFPPEYGWVVGCGYVGLPEVSSAIRNPIGASMAIRATAFDAAGGFSALVGRVGALPVGCEETEFCIRLTARKPGTVILYRPSSAVDHLVPADRQTLRYLVRRCFHEGRSKWAVTQLGGAKAGLAAERRYVRVVLPAGVLAGLGRMAFRLDPFAGARAAVIVLGLASTVLGFCVEALRDLVARRRS